MAKVWVQAWTAQVAGSVQVEESELAKVAGLENLKALVPMLVEVKESEWAMVPTVLVKDSPLVQAKNLDLAQVQESAQESARVNLQETALARESVLPKGYRLDSEQGLVREWETVQVSEMELG